VRRRLAFEILFISALILVTRCANYGDVFFDGKIYFVDADCYARMTRARICFEHAGTIVRRHDFENFPIGTSPHTTVPFDYLIVAVAVALTPLTNNALELAGAIVSPLLSVALGIFLCWWSRKTRIQFRWGLLILYSVSPILAHGFALGRPDHQSLLIALVTVGLCAEWSLTKVSDDEQRRDALLSEPSALRNQRPRAQDTQKRPPHMSVKAWSVVSGASWAMALWVSFYEPLVLVLLLCITQLLQKVMTARPPLPAREAHALPRPSRARWIVFAAILVVALLVERRLPQWPKPELAGALKNWSGTIGELSHVSLGNSIWFSWCGCLLLLAPVLLWRKQNRTTPGFLIALLIATFGLTIWQARWAYFFVMIFAMTLPALLCVLRKPALATATFIIALFPIAQSWDGTDANENLARRTENKTEEMELRAIASRVDGPFLAPWWFSPQISYWSQQCGVGGSSHEDIRGIVETAKFFATDNSEGISEFTDRIKIRWVVSYDADRVAQNSARILGHSISKKASCYFLDERASEVPRVLQLTAETGHFKLFRVSRS
jgi:hypothetical protein